MTQDQALQALQAALAAVPLVQGRSFPDVIPQGDGYPAIRWQQIGGSTVLANCDVHEDGDDLRIQIDCCALEYGQMRTLRSQMVAAIDGITTVGIYRAAPGRDMPFEENARMFRHTVDYIISLSNT